MRSGWSSYAARRGGSPGEGISHPARADSDKSDAWRAYAPAVGRASGSGTEYDKAKAQTKDGAGGGPAEERAHLELAPQRYRTEFIRYRRISHFSYLLLTSWIQVVKHIVDYDISYLSYDILRFRIDLNSYRSHSYDILSSYKILKP